MQYILPSTQNKTNIIHILKHSEFAIISLLVVVQLIFSLWPVFISLILSDGMPSILLALLRDVLASVFLWIFIYIQSSISSSNGENTSILASLSSMCNIYSIINFIQNPLKAMGVSEVDYLLFIGLSIASSVNSFGYILALAYVTPFNSALLHPCIPVFGCILAHVLGIEKLTAFKLTGSFVCIVGSIMVVASQADIQLSSSFIGNILLLCQSIAMAILLVGQKFVNEKYNPLLTTAIYYTAGTTFSLPIYISVMLLSDDFIQAEKNFSMNVILVLLYGSIFVIIFNYVALTFISKKSGPSIPSASMMLQPPFTYLLGNYLLGKQVSGGMMEIVGGVGIVIGLIVTVLPLTNSNTSNISSDYTYTALSNNSDELMSLNERYDFSMFSNNKSNTRTNGSLGSSSNISSSRDSRIVPRSVSSFYDEYDDDQDDFTYNNKL